MISKKKKINKTKQFILKLKMNLKHIQKKKKIETIFERITIKVNLKRKKYFIFYSIFLPFFVGKLTTKVGNVLTIS